MPTLSTVPDFQARLRSIPWHGLAGLSESVVAALDRVLGGKAADRELDALLRRNRGLSIQQRAAVAEAIFGVSLWRRRLAHHVGAANGDSSLLLFSLLRDLAGVSETDAARLAGVSESALPSRRAPPDHLAEELSLPDWLAARIEQRFGSTAPALARALNVPGPICVRANTLKTDRTHLAMRLAEEGVASQPTPYASHGLFLEGRPNILGLAAHQQGLFEVQDEGSQLLAELVNARPGETVLDYCAGSGGKTLALAAATADRGKVFAFDTDVRALDRLLQRAARAGVDTLRVFRGEVPADLRVDHVLVDAPCSALGALRRGPDLRFRIDPASLADFPPLQTNILERAARHVRIGGRLIYATCTFLREENEEVARQFQASHPDFCPRLPSTPSLDPSFLEDEFFHCSPHLHGTDAFFAAVYECRPT